MYSRIINLTLQLVIQEIEDALDEYPVFPYHIVFYNQEFRQNLITHVLNQFPNYYVVIEEGQEPPEDPKSLYSSLEEQLHMQTLIRGSILTHLPRKYRLN